ncbi:MAG: dipeptidase [Sedimentibacter sp.]
MLFDIHGDIWTDVTAKREQGIKNVIRDYHLDRFKAGNMAGGIFVVWADPPHDKTPRKRLLQSVKAMSMEINENKDIFKIIYSADDFYNAVNENKLAVLIGLEGLSAIQDDIEELYILYQLGFRHVSLTWNEQNKIATGVKGDPDSGLTAIGKEAVKIIENLGMILDVSHLNDKSFWDVYKTSQKPFIASHSNVRTLCNTPRNLTDDQIKAIGERDGLIGINSFNEFIHEDPSKRNLDYLIKHMEYIINLIGIDKVSVGFDFFEYLNEDAKSFTNEEYVGLPGLEDISKSGNLILRLKDLGYSKEDIDKISYKNFINYMDKVL